MKPWEWAAMPASEYYTARHVQEAWRKGVADADAEAKADRHQASHGEG